MREDLSGIVEVFSPTAESTSSCPGLAWQGGWWFPCYEGTPQAVWHTKLCPSTPFHPRITMTERQTWAEKVTGSKIESQVRNITVSAKVGILHSHPIPPRGPKGRCRCKGVSPGSARQLPSTPTPRQTSPALPSASCSCSCCSPCEAKIKRSNFWMQMSNWKKNGPEWTVLAERLTYEKSQQTNEKHKPNFCSTITFQCWLTSIQPKIKKKKKN